MCRLGKMTRPNGTVPVFFPQTPFNSPNRRTSGSQTSGCNVLVSDYRKALAMNTTNPIRVVAFHHRPKEPWAAHIDRYTLKWR
jgi:hypothetical protein